MLNAGALLHQETAGLASSQMQPGDQIHQFQEALGGNRFAEIRPAYSVRGRGVRWSGLFPERLAEFRL